MLNLSKVNEQAVCNSDCWEVDLSENTMDIQLIVPIYLRSLQNHHIMMTLGVMRLSHLQNSCFHFTAFEPSLITTSIHSDIAPLKEKLSTYGLSFVEVPSDGDCFFSAFSMNLLSDLSTWKHSLNLAGATNHEELTVELLAKIQRRVFVQELLGERQTNYKAFVAHTSLDYVREANRFGERKYFDSELGNTMPLALCTALQLSSVIFPRGPVHYPRGCSHRSNYFSCV